jgi:AraC family transcriptional activator of pobA
MDEIITVASLEEIAVCQSMPTCTRATREWLSILFIVKGNGRCIQQGEGLILEDKTVYTGPGNCFQQFEIGDGTIGYLLGVNLQKLATSFESVTVAYEELFAIGRSCIHLDTESAEEMDWVVTRILRGVRSRGKYSLEIVHKYVSLLLLCLKAQLGDDLVLVSMNRKGMLLKSFFSLLEDAFMRAKTVDYYADKLCVTAKHLTNVIKTESGYPTSYHINQRIVLEAKRMAITSGACLKQIAYELGYEDVSAFSKLFKRVSGETFSNYRCNLKFGYAKLDKVSRNERNRNVI